MPETVNIRGKQYQTVAFRVSEFRKIYPIGDGWSIRTEIEHLDMLELGYILMKATIYNPEGVAVATGHAAESRSSSKINETSFVENCETSAVGRALASAGLGGEEFATANEVLTAIENQEKGVKTGVKNEEETITKKQWLTERRAKAVEDMVELFGKEEAKKKHDEFISHFNGQSDWKSMKVNELEIYVKGLETLVEKEQK